MSVEYLVANLILLCSLKHISLLLKLEILFVRTWAIFIIIFLLFFHFFLVGIFLPIVFNILDIFASIFLLYFCTSHVSFLQQTFERNIIKNLEHLF
jgi:hypothetical protein